MYKTTVIPNRGAWLEFEQDSAGRLVGARGQKEKDLRNRAFARARFRLRQRHQPTFSTTIRMIAATIEKDTAKSEQDGLIELYRRLRPGEVPTDDSVRQHLHNLFFDPRRYDVVKVGRYKFNKKLNIAYRLPGCMLAEDVFAPETGELLAGKGEIVSDEKAKEIQNAGVNAVYVLVSDEKAGEIRHKIIGNNTVDFAVPIFRIRTPRISDCFRPSITPTSCSPRRSPPQRTTPTRKRSLSTISTRSTPSTLPPEKPQRGRRETGRKEKPRKAPREPREIRRQACKTVPRDPCTG